MPPHDPQAKHYRLSDPAIHGTAPASERAHVAMIMGLPFSLHLRGCCDVDAESAAVQSVWRDQSAAEALFSTYLSDSEISRIRRGELTIAAADRSVREVLALAERARLATAGTFDVHYAGALDPSGIVKGWAAAKAARHLQALGVDWYLGAGGDVLLWSTDGAPPWRVGIEDPADPARLLAVVAVGRGAVATSGSAHRGSHIIRPGTGGAPAAIAQATVYGPDLMWADVYATALVASDTTEPEWALPPGYECLLVTATGQTFSTAGLRGMLSVPEPGVRPDSVIGADAGGPRSGGEHPR